MKIIKELYIPINVLGILFLWSFPNDLLAQVPTIVWKTPTEARYFQVDKFGNTYLVDADNTVHLYTKTGKEQATYSDNSLGILQSIDVSNPLEILLYYPDFQVLKIVDRQLNLLATTNLTSLNRWNIPVSEGSRDGGLWLFDGDSQMLLKTSRQSLEILISTNLRLLLNETIQPTFLLEKDNFLLLCDPKAGIFVFDLFGNYIKNWEIKGCFFFQLENDQLLYLQNNQIRIFDTQTLETQVFYEADFLAKAQQIYWKREQLWVLENDQIKLFKL